MASLNMQSSSILGSRIIDSLITRTLPGNYALGRKNDKGAFEVCYVGRADSNVNDRLKSWVGNTKWPLFKFSYATSPKDAFKKECENFHDFSPPDNQVHPDRPDGSFWRCPNCNIFDL